MIDFKTNCEMPCMEQLIAAKAASRIRQKDATLYDFSAEAQSCAENFMGWATLASQPPCPIDEIQGYAKHLQDLGLETVVLIGQGGSTQAPMTVTKYHKDEDATFKFKTLDSVSPVRFRGILSDLDPKTTLFIHASKSGGTIEPSLVTSAVQDWLKERIPEEEIGSHFIAITDPGSGLEQKAKNEHWRHIFNGEPTVGGRYSALSVFGLVPAALVGIDLQKFVGSALEAEELCGSDSPDNPAIVLASFLYNNYVNGRDKFSFLSPKRGRVLGLWIEQLVAESVGKEGKGILPNIEVDSLTLSFDPGDRGAVVYTTKIDSTDEQMNFAKSVQFINPDIPTINFHIDDVYDLAQHFVMWEYATAMLGYLMQVCPFDQPDVQVAKTEVLRILSENDTKPTFTHRAGVAGVMIGDVEVNVSEALLPMMRRRTLNESLRVLIGSVRPGDFFAINAFVPFDGEGRREALEDIRHALTDRYGIAACLEIGPRYLHSTGQLHKGGPNKGIFLIISTAEECDIPVNDPRAQSLGQLAKAQAKGDFDVLSQRGRRAIHLHLPDNTAVSLRALAKALRLMVNELN